ncbi:MAG: ATP-grasp domain-containing protein [Candidatus Limiplasma sp.]|nr:ATP-grasp domain-containing protein [Candidatus Limiplasma sp.]
MTATLVTAAGSASAPAVVERLHALGHRVAACDIYPREWNQACMDADAFFQGVPASDAQAYTAQLEEAVKREGVHYLIPLTDVEVDVLCAQKARFAALGCTVCVPDEPCARLCRNKLQMAQALERDGVCRTIPTFSPYEGADLPFPLMLKPLHGRSSQGQAVVRGREALLSALSTRDDYIAQPYLEGPVYTVDVARDRFGHVQALARLELLRTVNGLGTTVRMLPGHPLEGVCASIAARAGVVGVVNMEFIEHGGEYWFLEVNPRFSGGLGFSVLAGVDFPALNLLCHAGEAIGARADARACIITRRISPVITAE